MKQFTKAEDKMLVEYRSSGLSWAAISKAIPGCTVFGFSQRYNQLVQDAIDGKSAFPMPESLSPEKLGSDALLLATVKMCIRRNITLPGLSPAHTIAIAKNLGLMR